MSTPDPIRALLAEIADELDHNRQCLLDDRSLTHPLADRARAVLARWGHPAAPPATTTEEEAEGPAGSPGGEARALARAIDEVAKGWHPQACLLGNVTAKQFRCAAALLRQYWLWLGRQHRLQQENHRFREPERTILCDILANGTLLPDPDGTRYGIPPTPAAGEVQR